MNCTCLSISRDPFCEWHGDADKVLATLIEQRDELLKAVMLAVLNIDCERNGLTPDGNVRDRLVAKPLEEERLVRLSDVIALLVAGDTPPAPTQREQWMWNAINMAKEVVAHGSEPGYTGEELLLSRAVMELAALKASVPQPIDTACDNDAPLQPCWKSWPQDPASWCDGCRTLRYLETTAPQSEPSSPETDPKPVTVISHRPPLLQQAQEWLQAEAAANTPTPSVTYLLVRDMAAALRST